MAQCQWDLLEGFLRGTVYIAMKNDVVECSGVEVLKVQALPLPISDEYYEWGRYQLRFELDMRDLNWILPENQFSSIYELIIPIVR